MPDVYKRQFLANAHVDALTEAFGTTCVAGMKNAVLGMDDRTVELQKEYNALVSQYQQVYGGALVEFDGKQLTIPQLGPYKEKLCLLYTSLPQDAGKALGAQH